MGGVMSDEVLCCIDGTQDICDLGLKREIHLTIERVILQCLMSSWFVVWPDINNTVQELLPVWLLTGRSLDILCRCLILWLRVLCVRRQSVTEQSVKAILINICPITSQRQQHCYKKNTMTQCYESTAAYPRSDIFLLPFNDKKRKEGKLKVAANYLMFDQVHY